MHCSHLDGHRRRPPIAFAGRPGPGRASAALLLWVPALSPRTHAWKITLSPHEDFWCRRSTALSSSWVSNLGESTVKETNRSFDRSRSKFADPRYRPRGRITKSVTVTTTYNRTILSGTAASAQYKMAKAALHLKESYICIKLSLRHSVERLRIFLSPHLKKKKSEHCNKGSTTERAWTENPSLKNPESVHLSHLRLDESRWKENIKIRTSAQRRPNSGGPGGLALR